MLSDSSGAAEAEALADRVSIIRDGVVVQTGSLDELQAVRLVVAGEQRPPALARALDEPELQRPPWRRLVEIGDAPQGLVIGKINQAYIDDAIAEQTDEGLNVDALKLNPLARLGGDEFTVVYERATQMEEIQFAGQALVSAFQQPLLVDGRELLIGLSVSASVFPEHGRDPEALLRAASQAGKGFIFVTGHLGSWELLARTSCCRAPRATFCTAAGSPGAPWAWRGAPTTARTSHPIN